MRRLAIAALVAAITGFATGWLSVRSAQTNADRETLRWSAPPERRLLTEKAALALLMKTGHFGVALPTEAEAAKLAAAEAAAAAQRARDAIPPFPQILATASLDGEVTVSLHGDDHSITTVRIGDTLPGGWKITDITLERVIVTREGAVSEFSVFPRTEPES